MGETLCGIVARLRVIEAAIRGINILVLAVFRTNFSGYFLGFVSRKHLPDK
jgi:hypothetical protein